MFFVLVIGFHLSPRSQTNTFIVLPPSPSILLLLSLSPKASPSSLGERERDIYIYTYIPRKPFKPWFHQTKKEIPKQNHHRPTPSMSPTQHHHHQVQPPLILPILHTDRHIRHVTRRQDTHPSIPVAKIPIHTHKVTPHTQIPTITLPPLHTTFPLPLTTPLALKLSRDSTEASYYALAYC